MLKKSIQESNLDKINTVWDVITTIGNWMDFDFSNANDYDFILAQLLMNNYTYKSFSGNCHRLSRSCSAFVTLTIIIWG